MKAVIDSRSIIDSKGVVFFAIRTAMNNGHKYVEQAYDQGVREFVIDENVPFLRDKQDTVIHVVDNVTESLQSYAVQKRDELDNETFVGITGSRGKTIVKEWLFHLLGNKAERSPRSYNSQIGVPLSILSLGGNKEFAIIEAGISRVGEMQNLQRIIRPKFGILTSITDEHDFGFESREEKIREKMKLFTDVEVFVYHRQNDTQLNCIVDEMIPAERQRSWSETDSNSFLYITSVTRNDTRTLVSYMVNNQSLSIVLPFTNTHDIEDAITVVTASYLLDPEFDVSKLSDLKHIDTRIDVVDGLNNCVLLYDKFTNDTPSLILALDFAARRITPDRKLILILDHIPQSEEFEMFVKKYNCKCICSRNAKEFMQGYTAYDFSNSVILIKGAFDAHFEEIVSMLENKQHETVMEINLDNLIHNYNFFKSKLRSETGIICMLKAEGYGSGSLQLAKTLQSQGAYAVAVAVIDEGIELRKTGITMPILVLNPRADNLKLMFEYHLEPEVYNIDILKKILAAAKNNDVKGFPIHLKLDTGMHRLGFDADSIFDAINIIRKQDNLKIASMFSHLATADCLDMDNYTQAQFGLFSQLTSLVQQHFDYSIKRHILNSAGILRFPEHQYDCVRLGIGLYGIPILNDGSEDELKQVASLYSVVIAVSDRMPGDTIGYSRKGLISRPSRIATIPIGYADGIDRHLGNGKAEFLINGNLCPTIGNICMDICMVDVTGCDCKPGDRVEIFGEDIPVSTLSKALDTIPYEILTSISERVKRIYYRE